MSRKGLGPEARNVVILAGNVLERSIEAKAIELAEQRESKFASEKDAKAAIDEVFTDGLEEVFRIIGQRLHEYEQRNSKAA
jgi:hypothetical protein